MNPAANFCTRTLCGLLGMNKHGAKMGGAMTSDLFRVARRTIKAEAILIDTLVSLHCSR